MTKKHFIAIAAIIKEAQGNHESPAAQEAVKDVAIQMAKYFRTQNSLFDYFRFIEACGIPE